MAGGQPSFLPLSEIPAGRIGLRQRCEEAGSLGQSKAQ